MKEEIKCPIWGTPAYEEPSNGSGKIIVSPRAGGRYSISKEGLTSLKKYESEEFKRKLTDWIVDQYLLGSNNPEINSNLLENYIARANEKDVFERMDRLVEYAYLKGDVGTVFSFYNREGLFDSYIPHVDTTKTEISFKPVMSEEKERISKELLAWTSSMKMSEVLTLAEFCQEIGFIELKKHDSFSEFMIKPKGYSNIYRKKKVERKSDQAFVAMWFDESMNDIYNQAIAPAIKDAGYKPLRIDRKQHNNKIDDEIIAEIRRSRFLVADFTYGKKGMRGGVYYEAGFAHGLGIPVIFTCKDAEDVDLHFDTRQYNHILWKEDNIDEFRQNLSNRISATIGDGPLKGQDKE